MLLERGCSKKPFDAGERIRFTVPRRTRHQKPKTETKMNAIQLATVTAKVTNGLAGGWDPMSGDWNAGRGERIKPVVLAAINTALAVAGVDYQMDVELFHADGREITDDLPASGTWVATRN